MELACGVYTCFYCSKLCHVHFILYSISKNLMIYYGNLCRARFICFDTAKPKEPFTNVIIFSK
jgi:hypothetical protein